MRVCHICFSFTIGGIENLLIDILNEQSKRAAVSLVIVNKKYNIELLSRISDKVNIILIDRPQGNKWNYIYIIKLWIFLLRYNPTIIHCHTHNLIRILFPFKRKCIYTIHQVGIPIYYLSKYKKLYSISEAVKADLQKRGSLNSILVYNGINFQKFLRRKDYCFNPDSTFNIVQVGRLMHEQKGQDILIKSMYNLVYNYNITNINLDIIGDGPSEKYLAALVVEYGLQEYVKLVGPRDRSWLYQNLCNYHLLIQPSRCEGFGLTLVEAIAAGLPVIASDIDGPAEILRGITSAFMFKTNNVEALTIKVRKVLDSYIGRLIEEKSNSAFTKIENRFSVATTAENYLESYTLLTYELRF